MNASEGTSSYCITDLCYDCWSLTSGKLLTRVSEVTTVRYVCMGEMCVILV